MGTVAVLARIPIALCLPLLASAFISRAYAAEVSVDAILVGPEHPGPSTLCTLKVRLKNAGARTASYFTFSVKIDGQDVPLYKSHTFVINIDPGTVGELELQNFYSPTSRKPFTIQVTLVEAQWVQVKKEGTNTTTTPSGPVAGLPASATLAVKM